MKVSYKWLDEYLNKKLPKVEKAVEVLTMNSSEVDGVEKIGNDHVLDVKILPNLAHSCLCHRGIAHEFSVLLDLPMKNTSHDFKSLANQKLSKLILEVKIENPKDCRRYIGRVIEGVKIGPSPLWLKNRLETLGQRSINNLVDATNFIMLEVGQPTHVFDADKIGGRVIEIKKAKGGDDMTTLDGKQVALDENVLVISNNNKALAIAGVKGGTAAEISPTTKNIVLESANFDPTLIRKTAQKLKIQTESSKRYENDLTPDLAGEAMDLLTKLIVEIAGTADTRIGMTIDSYPMPTEKFILKIKETEIEKILGLKISDENLKHIFSRLGFAYKKDKTQLNIEIPAERLDLRTREDMVEEIGRVYGYDKLGLTLPPKVSNHPVVLKSFYYQDKIRDVLIDKGFSEIFTSSFQSRGEIEIEKSLASDKNFLRKDLAENMKEALTRNAHYVDLIGIDDVKIFELGKVFSKIGELTNLSVGIKKIKKEKGVTDEIILKDILTNLASLNIDVNDAKIIKGEFGALFEITLTETISKLPQPKTWETNTYKPANLKYQKISTYPFISRDIAVFVPEGISASEVQKIILKEGTDLVVRHSLFDAFKKEDKVSYAYRLVFQSYEKTLSDEEINKIMTKITSTLNSQTGWQVR